MRRLFISGGCFFIVTFQVIAQKDSASFIEQVNRGMSFSSAAHYDSALLVFSKVLATIKKENLYPKEIATFVLNETGNCFYRQKDAVLAHQYFMLALTNARKYGHLSERAHTLSSLMLLHHDIAKYNLPFTYPAVSETEEDYYYVMLDNIKPAGDSLDITLAAGRFDGISESTPFAQVFTHIITGDTASHRDINNYGKARIVKLGDNTSLLRVKKDAAYTLVPGDFVSVKADVPLNWRQLTLRDFLLHALPLADNYRQPLYDYRFFYYYGSPELEQEVLQSMKYTVSEIADLLAEDTVSNKQFAGIIPEGIFAGRNVMKAMLETNPTHIRYFLDFVNEFPGKYVGNKFKFSEIYATWVINNTPFAKSDLRPYLLGFKTGTERQAQVLLNKAQLENDQMISRWVDEALKQTQSENLAEAASAATLLKDVTAATYDLFNAGWSDIIAAGTEKKNNNELQADSLLSRAGLKFKTAGNREGENWVSSMRDFWKKTSQVKVGVQTGHIFPYKLALSPNPRFFATGGLDHLVKIWDMNLGKEILTLNENKDEILSLHYSPNGRYLVSSSADSTICLWNAYTWSLQYRIKTAKPEHAVIFTPDGKQLVTGGEDSLIKFRDLLTGEIKRTLIGQKGTVNDLFYASDFLFSAGSDSMVRKWDTETSESTRWFRHGGKALAVKISNNLAYMSVVSSDSMLTIWDMETYKKIYRSPLNAHVTGDRTFYSTASFSPDSRYIAFPDKNKHFLVVDLKDFYTRSYPIVNNDYNLGDLQFSADGQSLFGRFDGGGPLRVFNTAGWDIRNKTTISWKDIRFYANLTVGVQFTDDDNGLVVMHNELSKIDLRTGSKEKLMYSISPFENRRMVLTGDSIGTVLSLLSPNLELFDFKKRETVKEFRMPENEKITVFEISKDNKYCFIGTESGMLRGWDMVSGKELFTVNPEPGNKNKIGTLEFDAFRQQLIVLTDDAAYLIDPVTGAIHAVVKKPGLNYAVPAADGIYFTAVDGWLYKLDADHLSLLKKMQLNKNGETAYQLVLSPDQRYLVVQNTATTVMGIRTADDDILYTRPDHDFGGTMITISHDGKLVASSGYDSKVNLFNTATGEQVATMYMPLDKDPLIADNEGHYLASRNTLDAVLFTYNNSAYTFDQFDLQFNRPDLVLKQIGRADTLLLKSYEAAYRKRLQKLKLDENEVSAGLHLPQVRIRNKYAIQTITTERNYTVTIGCSDSRFPLKSVQVLVNNTPLLGVNGKDISASSLNVYTWELPVVIPLSEGDNLIKVYCTNSRGISSLQESFSVLSKYHPEKPPQTYFFGIGVSDYRDKRMALQYPAKDIRDLAAALKRLYKGIIIDTLIDSRVTKENILAFKKKLLQTTVNDKVILAVNGHGLLSDSLDFYYATWDIDPMKPAGRGIRYDDLENLLTDIPARKKLMLIDACHSGALDKDELLALAADTTATRIVNKDDQQLVKRISPREKMLQLKQARIGANSSFEMMQRLFTDLSGNNGAVIISAAGGMEYALESGRWNNGVFTFCVLQGLETGIADLEAGNFDGVVTVQELQDYVSKRVPELTNGKQRPVSRRENIDYSWNIRL